MGRIRGCGWVCLVLAAVALAGCGGGGGGGGQSGNPGSPDTASPTIVSHEPADNASGVAMSGPFSVTFSEPIDPATISTDSVKLTSGGLPVTGNLAHDTVYELRITTGVKDLAGNNLASEEVCAFTTCPPPPGDVTGMLLLDNNLSVSYDNSTRTATIHWNAVASLDNTEVRSVRIWTDYWTGQKYVEAGDNAYVQDESGVFSFGSITPGYDYSFIAEKRLTSGDVRRLLGVYDRSYWGGTLSLTIPMRDVTPIPAVSRLDLFCSECHPSGGSGVVRCLHRSGMVPIHYYPHVAGSVVKLDDYSRVTCESCHTAHLPTGYDHFLVLPPPDATQSTLCLQCH